MSAAGEKHRDTRRPTVERVRVHEMVVAERRAVADLLDGLTPEQFATPSLCAGWTVHEVAAHLVTYLRLGQLKLYLGILATGGDFDRINVTLTRWEARRTSAEVVARLRRYAGSRVSIPRSGYDPVLADLVVHHLDIRRPLDLPGATPEDRLWVTFHHLVTRPGLGFGIGDRLRGLRLEATDTGWRHGAGAPVRGTAEGLLLACSGRPVGLAEVTGEGVPVLRERLAAADRPSVARRLLGPLGVLVSPPPPDRRSRAAVAP